MSSWLERIGIRVERSTEDYALAPLIVDGRLLTSSSSDLARLAVPAVYRAKQMLSDLSAQLSWAAVRGGKRSDQALARQPEVVDPTPMVMVDPSPFMTRDDVIRTLVSNLVLRGFAPLLLQGLDADGHPRFATPLNPDDVDAQLNLNGTRVEYRWHGNPLVEGIDLKVIEFQRLPLMAKGLGPLDAVSETLQGTQAANAWAYDLFRNSGIPSGTLSVPGKLTKPEAEELRKAWDLQHQGNRATAILSGGMEYAATALTPEQAQMLSARGFGIQEVARLLGIPQHLLNAGQIPGTSQSLTYTNVAAVFRELTTVTLFPTYLRRIEEAFTSFLPRGQEAIFDLSDLTQADDGTRFTAWQTAISAGILTVNEVREREGLAARDTIPAIEEISQ